MLRRSPMKRSAPAWAKPQRAPVVYAPIPEHLRRNVAMASASGMFSAAIEKEAALHSESYRRLVSARPCIHCGKQNRSQHAHENEGKGKGIKLDDRRAMPLCADEPGAEGCHTQFDQYRLLPGGREAHVLKGRAWSAQTRLAILAEGLWPANLPLWNECRSSDSADAIC